MIPFKIGGVKYNFPTRWEDVTYQQYFEMIRATSLTDQVHIFTRIPRETLNGASITNLEKINIALAFMAITPKFERTNLVGPYFVPKDIRIESLGQFEDLRGLLAKMPKKLDTLESTEQLAELYLQACAIYCQKVRDGKYDTVKAKAMTEEIKQYSCAEVLGTGAFFMYKPLNLSKSITTTFLNALQRLRKWSQDLPGYQKTLDFLQRSSQSPGK